MPILYEEVNAEHEIVRTERAPAQELSTTRWNFIYNDAQGVAYLLDPRYAGVKMSEGDKDMTEQFVADFVAITDENVLIELDNDQKRALRGAAYAELDAFYEMILRWKNANNPRLDSMMSGSTTPYGFWVSNAEKFPIVESGQGIWQLLMDNPAWTP
jgi:hypothetical protein